MRKLATAAENGALLNYIDPMPGALLNTVMGRVDVDGSSDSHFALPTPEEGLAVGQAIVELCEAMIAGKS